MERFTKNSLIILVVVIFWGCDVINENVVFSYFDKNEKSISIIAGSDPLIVGIKAEFIKNNWEITSFNKDKEQIVSSFSDISTRYVLFSEYTQGEDFILGPFVQDYEFTIYDLDTYKEIVIVYGSQRKVDQVIDEFKYILENNYQK